MPQNRSCRRQCGHTVPTHATSLRAALLRAAAGVIAVVLAASLHVPVARAQTTYGSGDSGSAVSSWTRFMEKIGLEKKPDSNIDYGERPPLVVPPTRDLPPPEAGSPPTPDWPKDTKQNKHAKAKPKPPPDSAPAVVENPNPPIQKKPWYNPAGWFDKEEYGKFTGEPPRADLTDPPAGYRTPSPYQPYGIGPDKEAKKKPAANGTPIQAATQAPTPAAAPTAPAPTESGTPTAPAPTAPAPTASEPQTQSGK